MKKQYKFIFKHDVAVLIFISMFKRENYLIYFVVNITYMFFGNILT